ncbi:MAG: hypothetical protein IH795_08405 [Bacteroidetes bacterium]|nr:hypothetical protein [Bacteroidota bacterium]
MTLNETDIVILEGVRTPFGAFGGSLAKLSATELGVTASIGAIEKSGVSPDKIDNIVFGNALQTSPDAIYLARHVGLGAGIPHSTPALTVNRLCGSGFDALIQAARTLMLGEAEYVLAGGAESRVVQTRAEQVPGRVLIDEFTVLDKVTPVEPHGADVTALGIQRHEAMLRLRAVLMQHLRGLPARAAVRGQRQHRVIGEETIGLIAQPMCGP